MDGMVRQPDWSTCPARGLGFTRIRTTGSCAVLDYLILNPAILLQKRPGSRQGESLPPLAATTSNVTPAAAHSRQQGIGLPATCDYKKRGHTHGVASRVSAVMTALCYSRFLTGGQNLRLNHPRTDSRQPVGQRLEHSRILVNAHNRPSRTGEFRGSAA
jgi:hypothetical protein